MEESRVVFLEQALWLLKFDKALEALDFVKKEMSADNGFMRHNGTHYYYHLIDTTQDLLNYGVRDEEILTACLLHDVIEDVDGVTQKMIADKWGENVARYVSKVSKLPGINYKNPDELDFYLDVCYSELATALIKTADRKHNFGTLRDASPSKKLRQALETERHFIPFFKKCRSKYPRYAAYFFAAKTSIEPHLNEIKEHYNAIESLKEEFAGGKQNV